MLQAELQALPVHIGRDMHFCFEDCLVGIVGSANMELELEAQALDSDLYSASQCCISGKRLTPACCIHSDTVDTSKPYSALSAVLPAEHVERGWES